MSRSNPNTGSSNPSTRWYEWNGEKGILKYYDKAAQKEVDVALPFTFILLDEMATVKGWHDASDSRIFSNEVRDTRQEVLVVKAFKGGELASGMYASIRDRVGNMGGHFVANLYIAYRADDKTLKIGSLQFKGAALGKWTDFRKASRKGVYEKAVSITGATEGKKGKVVFKTPDFKLTDISEASNTEATALDKELQAYLTAYLSRTKDQAAQVSAEDMAKADATFAGPSSEDAIAEEETTLQAARRAERTTPPPMAGDTPFDDEIPF